VEQILTAYYECQGLEYPRQVDCLTVRSGSDLVITASSSPTPTCHPTYTLRLHSYDTRKEVVRKIVLLFPSKHTHTFTATRLDLTADNWCTIFQNMRELLHLRLNQLDIGPVLDGLDSDYIGVCRGLLKSHTSH